MDLGLSGRHAVVLGASRGLGAAVARALLAEGATVTAAARSAADIEGWRAELPAGQADRLHVTETDLTDLAQVEALAAAATATRPVDILILNGGGPPAGPATAMTATQWSAQFAPMAAHLFHLAGLLVPGMVERGFGRVLTIASSGVEQPIPNLALSNAIRASVVGWSKTLASEVAAKGVTVNVVLPGRIHTDRVNQLDQAAADRQGRSRDEIAESSRATIPVGRYGRPEEFADVVAFLASERASYMTGAKIRVDGGLIRSI